MLVRLGHGMVANECNMAEHGGSGAYLDSVIDSVCCDLDATIAASYPGEGQEWANLIAAPADGAEQTDYNFWLGANDAATADDPAFTGTAGDAAAYFAFDGGDILLLKGENTTFLNQIHHTNKPWWIAATVRFGSVALQRLFSTWDQINGIIVYGHTTGDFVVLVEQNNTISNTTFTSYTAETDYVLVLTGDNNGNLKWALNATSLTSEVLSDPASTLNNAGTKAQISGRGGANQQLSSGSRLYSFAMGNEFLDDAKAAAIIAHLEARHGRDYTA